MKIISDQETIIKLIKDKNEYLGQENSLSFAVIGNNNSVEHNIPKLLSNQKNNYQSNKTNRNRTNRMKQNIEKNGIAKMKWI